MALIFNDIEVQEIWFNGVQLHELWFNGVQVFGSAPPDAEPPTDDEADEDE